VGPAAGMGQVGLQVVDQYDYLKFIVRSKDDSDCMSTCYDFCCEYIRLIYEHYLGRSYDFASKSYLKKPCILRKMFGKLDVHCNSIVTLALS